MIPPSRPRPTDPDAPAEQVLVRLGIAHPRGEIHFVAASLAWVDEVHLCLGCLEPTRGACGYEFPHGRSLRGLCPGCLDRLRRGEPGVTAAVAGYGRTLGDVPWQFVSAGPTGETHHAIYRCRWTGRRCKRPGWWRGAEWRESSGHPGYIIDADGKRTGEVVPAEEFA